MGSNEVVSWFFLIFAGAATLSALALFTRQPLLIAYIAVGCLLGPHGLAWIDEAELIADVGEIGIMFLLFLIGLDMRPSNLSNLLGSTVIVGLASTVAFFGIGTGLSLLFALDWNTALIIGATSAFSSTIIGIKLLPTTVLHHRHIGEVVVSLLLLQDLLAIILLLALGGVLDMSRGLLILGILPALIASTFLAVRYLLIPLMSKFDAFHEFLFLLAIGWCLAVGEAAEFAGLSLEIGAFIAGISLATSPIAQYFAEALKPLRDFFLVLFFFSVGANFDISVAITVLPAACALAVAMIVMKPLIYRVLFGLLRESRDLSWEVGFRLGQTSEFSLLAAYIAVSSGLITIQSSHIIQAAAIMTFIVSSYLVVFRYPTPIAIDPKLRRN